jgi:hypothetical protein
VANARHFCESNLQQCPSFFTPLSFKKRRETGLLEMMIRRESVSNAEFAHDSETDAIGERPEFVAMFAKPTRGGVETCRIDPFQAERLASLDRINKVCRSPMTVARQQQSDGFVGHIFSGEKMTAFAEQLLLKPERGCMMRVARVPKGEETCSIYEHFSCRHRQYG